MKEDENFALIDKGITFLWEFFGSGWTNTGILFLLFFWGPATCKSDNLSHSFDLVFPIFYTKELLQGCDFNMVERFFIGIILQLISIFAFMFMYNLRWVAKTFAKVYINAIEDINKYAER